ncbi:uncharacterized protein LOC125241779 isoform X2 [Leguminivora glycinivorella]|uniref:uncharacterized protein LOC125241779 isoform X2 n=1 Tax=Leguminivora glycinivorella TaxID=1035111 RepID=UPI00200F3D13|nr:uncharacterized protein LOC125241779 isoform X2 [Leguminivora glycinivorella]
MNASTSSAGTSGTDQTNQADTMAERHLKNQIKLYLQIQDIVSIASIAIDQMTCEEIEASARMCESGQLETMPILVESSDQVDIDPEPVQQLEMPDELPVPMPRFVDRVHMWPTDQVIRFLTGLPTTIPGVCHWCNYNFLQDE